MIQIKELHQALGQIEEEKHISKEIVLGAIADGLAAAYKKEYGTKNQVVRCNFNAETGEMEFTQVKTVVDETTVRPPHNKEVHAEFLSTATLEEIEEYQNDERTYFDAERNIYIDDAKKIRSHISLGDEIIFDLEKPEEEFGRLASIIAKQVLIMKLREATKDITQKEYEALIGTLLVATVTRMTRNKIILKTEDNKNVILPYEEKSELDKFKVGDTVKSLITHFENNEKSFAFFTTRKSYQFIEMLFKEQSPEIREGTVEIKKMAREIGSRTKIAVHTEDENIDPVGACVGQKKIRIMEVVRELHGEKIDIIIWSPHTEEFITQSLAPARVDSVILDSERMVAHVEVPEDQFSLAVGRGGQNVRLASRLCGWKININSHEEKKQKEREALETTLEEKEDPIEESEESEKLIINE